MVRVGVGIGVRVRVGSGVRLHLHWLLDDAVDVLDHLHRLLHYYLVRVRGRARVRVSHRLLHYYLQGGQ